MMKLFMKRIYSIIEFFCSNIVDNLASSKAKVCDHHNQAIKEVVVEKTIDNRESNKRNYQFIISKGCPIKHLSRTKIPRILDEV